jgi:hypothetical protein
MGEIRHVCVVLEDMVRTGDEGDKELYQSVVSVFRKWSLSQV